MTERIWTIAAGFLVVMAALFLWRNNLSAAFVTAAAGACAWFLSYRLQLRRKSAEQEVAEPPADSDEE